MNQFDRINQKKLADAKEARRLAALADGIEAEDYEDEEPLPPEEYARLARERIWGGDAEGFVRVEAVSPDKED
jgi:hypothetical protein